jgi:4,5-dihydroxyphthalate decarboxylase
MTLTLTCADYARVMPVAVGAVPADFKLELSTRGSWPGRAEMLRRATADTTVAGGESSMGMHLKRMDDGDRSAIALPIFVLRNFAARDLYVRQGSPLRHAADLKGKRVGMYSWTASGSIWYRHFLEWAGVEAGEIQWCIGDIDKPWGMQSRMVVPPGGSAPPPGSSLSQMLIAGELDAIYSPPVPKGHHPANGPIVRLYPDSREVERRYFRETGVFPPQHLIVLRREAWEVDRGIGRRMLDAFNACEDYVAAQFRSLPYATPWMQQDIEEMEATMGPNPYRHGLEANQSVMEQFCAQAHKLGLTKRLIGVDEYFREFLES